MQTREEYNSYMRDYMLRRYHQRRQEAIDTLGGYCAHCGNESDLEIDHIDPHTKEFDICSDWSVSQKRFDAELAKCQLLCESCHRDKTADEQSVCHGGGKTGRRNCRCDLCRPLKNRYISEYKRSQKAR